MTDTFEVDGRPVPFVPGQTVGAALVAAGVLSWRTTRVGGRPRGIFCGIGVCFDCLVTVDERPNRRACLELARPGARVRTQVGTGHDAAHADAPAGSAGDPADSPDNRADSAGDDGSGG